LFDPVVELPLALAIVYIFYFLIGFKPVLYIFLFPTKKFVYLCISYE
jgi:hypothetical protein